MHHDSCLKADRERTIALKTANSWHYSCIALLQAEVRVLRNQSATACALGVTCVHPSWLDSSSFVAWQSLQPHRSHLSAARA